ncbi:MAG: DNA polymerase III subunit gamma/tau [Thermodesulfovibrionales bacterium]|nr:DNA polymerase III subunit gamma/tau [Thermodesulfovibrionales bacterium]
MSYLVLARKWRPQTFEELIGQESICKILKNAISQNKLSHAYIFSGPRGVGKTTTARILSKSLNCLEGPTINPCGICHSCMAVTQGSSVDVIEIDGASNTGVENIRDLRERLKYAPSFGKYKIYIIDEVHMLSISAFNALLKTLEEPPSHVIFVLATTEPRKIPPTVLSRCQHLSFKRISHNKIKERLDFISKSESINITPSAIDLIARAADGSMRDALTILDQVNSFSDVIDETEVRDLLGLTEIEILSNLLLLTIEGDRKGIVKSISNLTNAGVDLRAVTRELLLFLRKSLILKITQSTEDISEITEAELKEITKINERTSEEHLVLLFSELLKAEPYIRNAYFPRVALEITLIKLSLLSHFQLIDNAIESIKRLQDFNKEPSIVLPTKKDSLAGPLKVSEHKEPPNMEDKDIKLQEIWQKTIEKIEIENPPLACKLKDCTVTYGENKITLTFKDGHSIHIESVRNNLEMINNMISTVANKDISIEIENIHTKQLNKSEVKEKALKNPVIQEALKLFNGKILEIIPNNKNGGIDV